MCLVVVTNLDDFKSVSVLSQSRGVEDGRPHPTVEAFALVGAESTGPRGRSGRRSGGC